MQPRKTDRAHAALQTHRAGLDMRQRRILIMADGRRTLPELVQLLGPQTEDHIAALIRQGYLEIAQAHAPQIAKAPDPAPRVHRRSLIAARFYLQGILELQRDPRAEALHRRLHDAPDDATVLEVMREAVLQLPAITSPGYAQRVQARLAEAVPEHYGDALKAPQPPAITGSGVLSQAAESGG